jgi:hypothetical protein
MSDPRVPGLFLVCGHVCTADCCEGVADGTIAFRRDTSAPLASQRIAVPDALLTCSPFSGRGEVRPFSHCPWLDG